MHIRVGATNPVADYINGLMRIKNCNLSELAESTGMVLSTLYRLSVNNRAGNINTLSMLVRKTGIGCHIVVDKEV